MVTAALVRALVIGVETLSVLGSLAGLVPTAFVVLGAFVLVPVVVEGDPIPAFFAFVPVPTPLGPVSDDAPAPALELVPVLTVLLDELFPVLPVVPVEELFALDELVPAELFPVLPVVAPVPVVLVLPVLPVVPVVPVDVPTPIPAEVVPVVPVVVPLDAAEVVPPVLPVVPVEVAPPVVPVELPLEAPAPTP